MKIGMYVKNAAGEWVYVGTPTQLSLQSDATGHSGALTPDADSVWFSATGTWEAVDPEAELQRSTYERPSDDELRNRLRQEFGV